MGQLRVLAITGSIRKGSYNRMLAEANKSLAPEGMTIEHFLLDNVPIYNMDLEAEQYPASAKEMKDAVLASDGVLFITPEHNFSFSGVLKNAIDWGSRPYGQGCWNDKPVAIQSASPGYMGGVRAQMQLRQVLNFFPMKQLYFPEVTVSAVDKKFDSNGTLIDERTIDTIQKQLIALKDLILQAKL